MKTDSNIFLALHNSFLQDWLFTYGIKEFHLSFWFFIFIFLLFFIGITTFVCGLNRFLSMLSIFIRNKKFWPDILKFYPSFIHFGFLILMIAQLISHTIGIRYLGNILRPNDTINIPYTSIKLTLKKVYIDFFNEKTKFLGMANKARDCGCVLEVSDGKEIHNIEVFLNQPAFYKGWFIFIADFMPKSKGIGNKAYINLMIKKDPGVWVLVVGTVVFGLGIFMFLCMLFTKGSNNVREKI